MHNSSFEAFYNMAKTKADEALNTANEDNIQKERRQGKAVLSMRANLSEVEKSLFHNVAMLDEEKKNLLNAKKHPIKFSLENLTKNIINHPEISIVDYLLLLELIEKTRVLIYIPKKPKETEKLYCFCHKEKFYAVIIKTTGNKEENYVQSFHFTDLKSLEGVKRRKGNEVIYDKTINSHKK